MLPPSADKLSTIKLVMPCSCCRVRAAVASTRPNAAAQSAVATVMTANPGRCVSSGSLNASMPHVNMTQIPSTPSPVL